MTAAPVREAATVLLLRDGASGLETWLLRRVSKMAFAPGMSVFPGGGVDPADSTGDRSSIETQVAEQLGVEPSHAAILLRTAAREVAEETNVRLPLEDIYPWSRWVTPEDEPRRYDTYFFVAVLPEGELAAGVTGEASHADWIPVHQALAEYEQGSRPMLPPTVLSLTEIHRYGSTARVLAAAAGRRIRVVKPVLRALADGSWVADLGDGELLPLASDFTTSSGKKLI